MAAHHWRYGHRADFLNDHRDFRLPGAGHFFKSVVISREHQFRTGIDEDNAELFTICRGITH